MNTDNSRWKFALKKKYHILKIVWGESRPPGLPVTLNGTEKHIGLITLSNIFHRIEIKYDNFFTGWVGYEIFVNLFYKIFSFNTQ